MNKKEFIRMLSKAIALELVQDFPRATKDAVPFVPPPKESGPVEDGSLMTEAKPALVAPGDISTDLINGSILRWDRNTLILYWAGKPARRYHSQGRQTLFPILDLFQSSDWPRRLPVAQLGTKYTPEAVKRYVSSLNGKSRTSGEVRKQAQPLLFIEFKVLDGGESIGWEPLPPARNDSGDK